MDAREGFDELLQVFHRAEAAKEEHDPPVFRQIQPATKIASRRKVLERREVNPVAALDELWRRGERVKLREFLR